MRKFVITGAVFLLITGPGAIDAWLSLIDRFFGDGQGDVAISIGSWYTTLFPLIGLAVLLFSIWWTRDQDDSKGKRRTSGGDTAVATTLADETRKPSDSAPVDLSTFVEASAADLIGLYRGVSTIEANRKIAPYIGKMMRIMAIVEDVTESFEGHLRLALDEQSSDASAYAEFGKEWNDEILKLQLGEQVTVVGTISRVSSWDLNLESCSLATRLGIGE